MLQFIYLTTTNTKRKEIINYELQKQICELYNQEILNHIVIPESEELQFKMINSFYEKMDLLITFSTIKKSEYLKEI